MPRKTLITALLFSIILPPASALAANWIGIGSKDKARIEIDNGSIHTTSDKNLRIWYREVYAKPKTPDSGAFSYTRLTTLSEFQCDKRLSAPIQRIYTAADGSELKTESFDSREPKPVIPDSALETVLTYACKHQNKPVVAIPPPPPPPPPPIVEAPKKSNNGRKEEPSPPPPPPPWSYKGNNGPDKWGSLSYDYAACTLGQRQSPIDIRNTVHADLPPIKFSYKPSPLSIIDDGHGIRVDTPNGGSITVDGVIYELQYLRFHKPGEMKINGKAADMDVQLVHQSKTGQSAILTLMIEADKAKKGKAQEVIRTLWNELPLEQDKLVTHAEIKIDPTLLLPSKVNYFTFIGSLTTPPCTEGVLWLVLKTPVLASKEQIAGFGTIYKGNVRPVQAVNERVIKASR